MHCSIDQTILDSTDPGIPASQNVAKIKGKLVASDTCTPETNPSSTHKVSALSHAYILDKSTLSDVTALSDSQESYAPRLAHSHEKSAFSDTAKKTAFSDAQISCATRHSHSHDRSAFSDTAKTSACSDAHRRYAHRQADSLDKFVFSGTAKKAAFTDAQKIGVPRHAQSHDRFAFSDTTKTSTFSDAAAFSDAQKTWTPDLAIGSSTFRDVTACSDAAAFSGAQINRTPLQAQETQAFPGVAAARRAQKRDAHSTCKPESCSRGLSLLLH